MQAPSFSSPQDSPRAKARSPLSPFKEGALEASSHRPATAGPRMAPLQEWGCFHSLSYSPPAIYIGMAWPKALHCVSRYIMPYNVKGDAHVTLNADLQGAALYSGVCACICDTAFYGLGARCPLLMWGVFSLPASCFFSFWPPLHADGWPVPLRCRGGRSKKRKTLQAHTGDSLSSLHAQAPPQGPSYPPTPLHPSHSSPSPNASCTSSPVTSSRPGTGRRQPPKYPPPNFQYCKRDLLEVKAELRVVETIAGVYVQELGWAGCGDGCMCMRLRWPVGVRHGQGCPYFKSGNSQCGFKVHVTRASCHARAFHAMLEHACKQAKPELGRPLQQLHVCPPGAQ
eukprot:1160726-Pelagomonas_calceolata.AAC.4